MLDFHLHSDFSDDCDIKMEYMVKSAINKGLETIAITDHIDYDFYGKGDKIDWVFDREDYFKEIDRLSDIYGSKIEILKGVELGIQPFKQVLDKSNKFLDGGKFDFIISSKHTCDSKDLYYKKFFEGKTPSESMRGYYEEYIECCKLFKNYSVLGHLDLPIRYDKDISELDPMECGEHLEELFKILRDDNKGIEINTGAFRYGLPMPNPSLDILKFYKEKKCEIVTFGSDAHTTDYIGTSFKETLDYLESAGFKYICKFRNMKEEFISIASLKDRI